MSFAFIFIICVAVSVGIGALHRSEGSSSAASSVIAAVLLFFFFVPAYALTSAQNRHSESLRLLEESSPEEFAEMMLWRADLQSFHFGSWKRTFGCRFISKHVEIPLSLMENLTASCAVLDARMRAVQKVGPTDSEEGITMASGYYGSIVSLNGDPVCMLRPDVEGLEIDPKNGGTIASLELAAPICARAVMSTSRSRASQDSK